MKEFAELAYTLRGSVVDNVYRGSVAVADVNGQIHFALGDPDYRAFIRSAAKPLQALVLVELGGIEAFGLNDAELAIICASHNGGDIQVRTVRSILKKIGVDESALHAGSGIKDNCSGKHAGMLALARLNGYNIEGYYECDHPVQTLILERVSEMCGLPLSEIDIATDGCGVPILAMPLRNMAVGYARLANINQASPTSVQATRRILQAIQDYSELVGGLDFRSICNRKIVAKSGASGCYCAVFLQSGLGFAMKIAGGTSEAIHSVFFEVARRLELIEEAEFERFINAYPPVVKNRHGHNVGSVRIAF